VVPWHKGLLVGHFYLGIQSAKLVLEFPGAESAHAPNEVPMRRNAGCPAVG